MFTVLSLDSENPWYRCRQLAPAVKSAREGGAPPRLSRATWGVCRASAPWKQGTWSGRLVGRGSRAQGVFRDLGAGWVDAGEVLDITVTIHLKSHDGLFHGLLVAAGRGEETFCKGCR